MQKELVWFIILLIGLGVVQFFAGRLYQKNKDEEVPVDHSEVDLEEYDELPPGVAVTLAWTEGQNKKVVRDEMPVLGRALDRMSNINVSEKGSK